MPAYKENQKSFHFIPSDINLVAKGFTDVNELNSKEILGLTSLLSQWEDHVNKLLRDFRLLLLTKGNFRVRHYETEWQSYNNYWQEPEENLDTTIQFSSHQIINEIFNSECIWVNHHLHSFISESLEESLPLKLCKLPLQEVSTQEEFSSDFCTGSFILFS
jgi:hypothetical protein